MQKYLSHAIRCEASAKDLVQATDALFAQLVTQTAALLSGRMQVLTSATVAAGDGSSSSGGSTGVSAWLQATTFPQGGALSYPLGSPAGPPLQRRPSSSSGASSSPALQRPSTGGRAALGESGVLR